VRTFIALPLPPEAREELRPVARRLEEAWPGLAWAGEANWHITLAFLGDQEEDGGIAAARVALASMAAPPCPAPLARFGRLGLFPARGPWRVLVANLLPPKSLDLVYTRLNRALAAEARRRGLPPLNQDWLDADRPASRPARPFRAHVTLARRREGGSRNGYRERRGGPNRPASPEVLDPGLLEEAENLLSRRGDWPLGACVLYKSELRPGGAIYTELDRVALAGNAGPPPLRQA
jgi:2'-5' RNA ligase